MRVVSKFVNWPALFSTLKGRREQELNAFPKLRKFWKLILKKDSKESEEGKSKLDSERRFLQRLMKQFLHILNDIPLEGETHENG